MSPSRPAFLDFSFKNPYLDFFYFYLNFSKKDKLAIVIKRSGSAWRFMDRQIDGLIERWLRGAGDNVRVELQVQARGETVQL